MIFHIRPGLKATNLCLYFPGLKGRGFYRRPAHAGTTSWNRMIHPVRNTRTTET